MCADIGIAGADGTRVTQPEFSQIVEAIVPTDGTRAGWLLEQRRLRFVTVLAGLRTNRCLPCMDTWGAERKAQWGPGNQPVCTGLRSTCEDALISAADAA
jgi:hypothetical protein